MSRGKKIREWIENKERLAKLEALPDLTPELAGAQPAFIPAAPEDQGKPGLKPKRRPPGFVASSSDPAAVILEIQKMQEAEALANADTFAKDYVSGVAAAELRRLLVEQARRKTEALAIYEPLPVQAAFHESYSRVRLARGSNRGGKTLPAAIEVARAVTGKDPYQKYPKEDGRAFCVGKDLSHVGQVMYRKLFRAGAFKMIKDLSSGKWRAYRPWDDHDLLREKEARPAPPLIPARMVKHRAWYSKGDEQPSVIRLTNGWELSFFSSNSKPPQGSDIDLWWFDEEIVDGNWYPEMSARTLDRRGKGIWSATPQAGTDQLFELHERSNKERGKGDGASVREFVILLADNPHIRDEDKEALAADLSEEDRRVRIGGEFAILSFKVYPEFNMLTHGMDFMPVPHDWCRILVVDPGHQVCAALFAAVPPKGEGDFILLYDELYLYNCDAHRFGRELSNKATGQRFQTFLIDPHGSMITDIGSGKSVSQQYSEALVANGVRSVSTGFQLAPACDDIEAGLMAVHGWLHIRQCGTTKLRVLRGVLENFEWEIKRYHKKRVAGVMIDKPDHKKNTHLMDCLRYLALYNPRYVAPPGSQVVLGAAVKAFRAKMGKKGEGEKYVRLG